MVPRGSGGPLIWLPLFQSLDYHSIEYCDGQGITGGHQLGPCDAERSKPLGTVVEPLSSDCDSCNRPLLHQKVEREQSAIICYNSWGVYQKSRLCPCLYKLFFCSQNSYTARYLLYHPVISNGMSKFVFDEKLCYLEICNIWLKRGFSFWHLTSSITYFFSRILST